MHIRTPLSALAVMALAAPALADGINFDNFGVGAIISNQYAQATFSTEAGQDLRTYTGAATDSAPNFLCTFTSASDEINCTNDIYVDFTDPVNNLTFTVIEPNEFGVVGRVRIFQNGQFSAIENIIGLAQTPNTFGLGFEKMDLSGYASITRIEIVGPTDGAPLDNSYGGGGIGLDTLSFTVVPAPSALGVFGLAGTMVARRRRSV